MSKPENRHFTYEQLHDEYFPVDHKDVAVKMGYTVQYGIQRTPDNVEHYPLPDGNFVAIATDYNYDDSSYALYLATPETDEDRAARVARQEAKALKAKELKAQENAAKEVAKSQELDKAKKALEKAGFKVTK